MTDHVRRLLHRGFCPHRRRISTVPDLDSFAIFPAAQPRQGSLSSVTSMTRRKPFVGDPRHVLKLALKRAEEMGLMPST